MEKAWGEPCPPCQSVVAGSGPLALVFTLWLLQTQPCLQVLIPCEGRCSSRGPSLCGPWRDSWLSYREGALPAWHLRHTACLLEAGFVLVFLVASPLPPPPLTHSPEASALQRAPLLVWRNRGMLGACGNPGCWREVGAVPVGISLSEPGSVLLCTRGQA